MAPPAFDPNAAYSVPAFDPNGSFQAEGATSAQPPAQPAKPAYAGFTPSNILSNVGQGLKDLGKGTIQTLSDIGGVVLPQSMGGDPINNLQLVHHIVGPMNAQAAQARQDFAHGDKVAGYQHAIASGVPVVGPWYSGLTDQAASGDIGGALAKGATQVLAPKAVAEAVPVAIRKTQQAALLGKTPEALYESALKPSTTMSTADRAAIVKTGLQNEIPVSKEGAAKLGDLIEDYNQKIKDVISSDPTRPIDPNKVATRADIAKAKFNNQVNAQPDLDAIEASRQQFLKEQGAKPAIPPHPTGILDAQGNPIMTPERPATPAQPMNAADAQAMKQGTYRVLAGKYGEQGSAAVEAQKALARGLKEEIANQFPEINGLNAAESKLLDLQPVLERAVNRIANHQTIGIGTPVAGAAAKAVTGSGGAGLVASVLKSVVDNPTVKSRLAIAVSKGAKIPYGQAAARVQAYSTALGSAVGGSQAYSNAGNPNQSNVSQP